MGDLEKVEKEVEEKVEEVVEEKDVEVKEQEEEKEEKKEEKEEKKEPQQQKQQQKPKQQKQKQKQQKPKDDDDDDEGIWDYDQYRIGGADEDYYDDDDDREEGYFIESARVSGKTKAAQVLFLPSPLAFLLSIKTSSPSLFLSFLLLIPFSSQPRESVALNKLEGKVNLKPLSTPINNELKASEKKIDQQKIRSKDKADRATVEQVSFPFVC